MALVWKTNAAATAAGPCATCAEMDGKRDGDGWDSTRPAGYNTTGPHGPPPMHQDCACTTHEETAREWTETIQHAA